MKYHDSICNCHSFFKKICPHHLQFNIAITYFIFQGSKRFLSKTKFFRKNSIHELDFISRMLVFSFLSYFLLMKRKIKITETEAFCVRNTFFLSFSFSLLKRIFLISVDSHCRNRFIARNFWRMVESHHVEQGGGRLNESWHANSLCSIRKSIVKIRERRAIEATKKDEMAK